MQIFCISLHKFLILCKNYQQYLTHLRPICLFDTKTCNSDEDATEKNNALYEYCQDYCKPVLSLSNGKGKEVIGGVIINPDKCDNWYYPNGLIENTANTDGWSVLNLNDYQ